MFVEDSTKSKVPENCQTTMKVHNSPLEITSYILVTSSSKSSLESQTNEVLSTITGYLSIEFWTTSILIGIYPNVFIGLSHNSWTFKTSCIGDFFLHAKAISEEFRFVLYIPFLVGWLVCAWVCRPMKLLIRCLFGKSRNVSKPSIDFVVLIQISS